MTHKDATELLAEFPVGATLPPYTVAVSPAANERYWRSAGVDHPTLQAGALYPPLAANLVILTIQQVEPTPLLHARSQLVAHRIAETPAELMVIASVADRYERRGRAYVVVTADITTADQPDPLWTASNTFTTAGR